MESNNNDQKPSISWLTHPKKLFEPSKEDMEKKFIKTDGGLKQNDMASKIIPQSINPHSNISMNNDEMAEKKSTEEPKNYELECLELIQNFLGVLTAEDDVVCNVVNTILDLNSIEDLELRSLKYGLLDMLLVNLLESTPEELKSIEREIKAMVLPDSLKKLVVNSNALIKYEYLGGFSSKVLSATLFKDGVNKLVVVKKPLEERFIEKIMNEAKILSECDHKNIIKIFAIVRNGPEIAIEMMGLGNLQRAMLGINFSDKNLMKIFVDVATGMEYLHGKQYLHRNLISLNIFINSRKQCKIGGFGSCVYVGDTNGLYEEKGVSDYNYSVSPETFKSNIFRYQSDVWAMGLLIWDIYDLSRGDTLNPLKYLALRELRLNLVELKKPVRCPNNVFSFVENCLLHKKYTHRPSFTAIRKKLESYL